MNTNRCQPAIYPLAGEPVNGRHESGVWEVQERQNPRGGGLASAEHKLNNGGQYIHLQRRASFSRTVPDVPVTDEFQGFDDDVSVYRLAL